VLILKYVFDFIFQRIAIVRQSDSKNINIKEIYYRNIRIVWHSINLKNIVIRGFNEACTRGFKYLRGQRNIYGRIRSCFYICKLICNCAGWFIKQIYI